MIFTGEPGPVCRALQALHVISPMLQVFVKQRKRSKEGGSSGYLPLSCCQVGDSGSAATHLHRGAFSDKAARNCCAMLRKVLLQDGKRL